MNCCDVPLNIRIKFHIMVYVPFSKTNPQIEAIIPGTKIEDDYSKVPFQRRFQRNFTYVLTQWAAVMT